MTRTKNYRCALFSTTVVLLIATVIVVCPGCSEHPGRAAIVGQVKFKDGSPIERGSIDFSPVDAQTTNGSGGAPIIDGHYHISREKGLRTGRYVVRIYASATTGSPQGPPGQLGLVTPPELISPQFNTQSKLIAEVQNIRDQQFDFEVE